MIATPPPWLATMAARSGRRPGILGGADSRAVRADSGRSAASEVRPACTRKAWDGKDSPGDSVGRWRRTVQGAGMGLPLSNKRKVMFGWHYLVVPPKHQVTCLTLLV